jgi:phosphinothricin acetyltransferase
MPEVAIRDATESDADAISSIYAHHVLTGTASYDIEPPSAAATRDKIWRITQAGWPFLVAEADGEIAGYAYVTQFRDRAAYRFTAEDSIYVHPHHMRKGVGKALLEQLLKRSAEGGFRTVIAVVGGADPASIALHRTCGFEVAGRLRGAGFKFGRWLDNVYLQIEFTSASES